MLITRHDSGSLPLVWRARAPRDGGTFFDVLSARLRATESRLGFLTLFALWAPIFTAKSLAEIARTSSESSRRRPPRSSSRAPAIAAGGLRAHA